jgi:hypothetical protein
MEKNYKIGAVIIGVLFLVVVAGLILTQPSASLNGTQNNSNQSANSGAATTSSSQTWHQSASFTGTGNIEEYKKVNIKGSHFKVVMSAMPNFNKDINVFDVDVYSGNVIEGPSELVATNTINWGANEKPVKKEGVIQVKEGKGTYTLLIITGDLESWSVTVWDYY